MNTNIKLYYAQEVANIIGNGLTGNMVGRIANQYKLKSDSYGIFVQDEVNPRPGITFHASIFKYNEQAIELISNIWNKRKK